MKHVLLSEKNHMNLCLLNGILYFRLVVYLFQEHNLKNCNEYAFGAFYSFGHFFGDGWSCDNGEIPNASQYLLEVSKRFERNRLVENGTKNH